MKCVEKEKLMEFLDGELDTQESLLVKKHLDECEDCTDYLQEMGSLVGMVQELTPQKAPSQLRDRIQNQMKILTLQRSSQNYSFRSFFSMAAALLLFAMGGYFFYSLHGPSLSERTSKTSRESENQLSKTAFEKKSLVKEKAPPPSTNSMVHDNSPREEDAKNPQSPRKVRVYKGGPSAEGRATPAAGKREKEQEKKNKTSTEGNTGKAQRGKDLAVKVAKNLEEKNFSRAQRDALKKNRRKGKAPVVASMKKEFLAGSLSGVDKKVPTFDALSGYLQSHPQALFEVLLLSSNMTRARRELLKTLPSGATLQNLRFGLNEAQILKSQKSGKSGKWPYQCMLFEVKVPSTKTITFLMNLEKLSSLRYFPGTSPRHFLQLQGIGNPQQTSNQGEVTKTPGLPESPPAMKKPAQQKTPSEELSKISLKIWVYQSQ